MFDLIVADKELQGTSDDTRHRTKDASDKPHGSLPKHSTNRAKRTTKSISSRSSQELHNDERGPFLSWYRF